ncbi:MAG TPA: heavy metal translocating P-type ATPase [Candidatus Kapabacteria bacterium]|nr:heavy metal translocating P-type ATPase [Candidatus Kapabacteria bacterium]
MIRAVLEGMEGVDGLEFNLIARTLTVQHASGMVPNVVGAIGRLGMEAVEQRPRSPEDVVIPLAQPSFWRSRAAVLTSVALLAALAAEILSWTPLGEGWTGVRLLAVVAIVAGGYQSAAKAWQSVRTLSLNIHFLMVLAVLGAVALGQWTEAGMVIALFAVAELVEWQSLNRARRALRSLMEVAPGIATVLRGGRPVVVNVETIRCGELVRIKPGERLPVDGIVRSGTSEVNQAAITGESMPSAKGPGDEVFAGSINGSGTLDFEVTHTAADSTINRIAELMERATVNRGRTERFVDRFARYYTPAVFVMALLVALLPPLFFGGGWEAWAYRGLVLLVIGCPCALVISTPVTVVSGLANAARRGILVKGGEFLERGHALRAIAFDKTGTLTEARPRVTDLHVFDGLEEGALLHLAAAVEARSEHPIAGAIVAEHERRHADEGEILVESFEALVGRGARGDVNGQPIYVGNHRLAHDLGVCSDRVEQHLFSLERDGKTTVVVMNERTVLGVIGVADTIRASSAAAVAQLRELGVHTAILTGDNHVTARTIARELAIEDIYADLLPQGKIEALAELEARHGAPVGMVGEGVNDVPALAHASVGFVMGAAGVDVALETADVALMDDDLRKIPEFIRLSHHTLRVLKQNIAIALALKLIFFVLAVAGVATLWMAVFADMGASLIVVANGLRLLRGGIPQPRTISPGGPA